MTMNRAIHAAVRRDLDRLEPALRAAADGDRARASALLTAWDNLRGQLVHHHEQEDALIWPALAGLGVDATLLSEMEQEHEEMAAALTGSDQAMRAYGDSARATDAALAADSIVSTRGVVERHLTHEETELEPELLRHRETPEWRAVEKQLRSGPPTVGGRMFAWLLDGSEPEADRYVRAAVPGPVLFLLTRVFGRAYYREVAPVWRS